MQRIYDTIEKYKMIEPGMHVIAGISGGADSVCLLTALADYRKQVDFVLHAVHVEHGIRGEESLADAAYVEQLCSSFGVELRVEHIDAVREARQRGQSVEEAGRAVRYELFERAAAECGDRNLTRIAVAHNQNDQAETMLWNLVRGSGLRGLCGMWPVRDRIIRPLLFLERSEIEKLLTERGISWRTDRTNLETEYTRNRIRLQILPQLAGELNARAVSHMAEAAQRLREVQDYVSLQTEQAARRCVLSQPDGIMLDLACYREEPELIQQELLKYCLSELRLGQGLKDIGNLHLAALRELCGKSCGKSADLPGGIMAVREKDSLCFRKRRRAEPVDQSEGERQSSEIPLVTGTEMHFGIYAANAEITENQPSLLREILKENKYTKWLSYDTINSNVCFRTRRPGDYLTVNETGGHKKLKDYLIDQKVPQAMRDQIWLLADGSHILWVIGMRISEAAKVKQTTEKILKIQIEEEL